MFIGLFAGVASSILSPSKHIVVLADALEGFYSPPRGIHSAEEAADSPSRSRMLRGAPLVFSSSKRPIISCFSLRCSSFLTNGTDIEADLPWPVCETTAVTSGGRIYLLRGADYFMNDPGKKAAFSSTKGRDGDFRSAMPHRQSA